MSRQWWTRRVYGIAGAALCALVLAWPAGAAAQSIVRITITPATVDLGKGEVALLSAVATFSDNSTANISELVDWRSTNAAVATVSNIRGGKGKVTAKGTGHASISVVDPLSGVTSGQSGGSAVVQVLGKLESLKVTPPDRKMDAGASRPMIATGTFSGGQVRDLTEVVQWTSSDPTVVAVSNAAGTRGRVTALAPGSARISVTSSSGVTSTASDGDATIRVPAVLVSIRVLPASNRLPVALTLSLNAQGTFSDGSTDDLSNNVTWTSSAPTVASVSNATGSEGEVTALQNGSALISVFDPDSGISSTPAGGDALVTVAGSLVAIAVDPTEDTIPTGITRPFSVQATLDDGSTLGLSRRNVVWTSSNPAAATVGNDATSAGIVTGVAKGTAVISAVHPGTGIGSTASGKDATVTILGPMTGIAVRPKSRAFFTGQTQRFTAFAITADGEAKLTRDVVFASSDDTIAAISNKSGNRGDVVGMSKGKATISVTYKPNNLSSSTSGADAVATVRGRVESLRIDPKASFFALHSQPKLKARATFDDGSSDNIGSDVVWTSSDPSIADIGNKSPLKAVLQPKAVGQIMASAVEPVSTVSTQASNGNGTITIVDGLLRLHVKDDALEMRTGDVVGISALGTYPNPVPAPGGSDKVDVEMIDCSTLDPADVPVTDCSFFRSSDPSVVRVRDGQVLAVGLGEATVSATDGQGHIVSSQTDGDAHFKVIAALAKLKVKPPRIRVRLGGRRRHGFAAFGIYTDKARLELTDRVTWSSSNPDVAQVSNAANSHGLVVPAKPGVAIVTATEPVTGVLSSRPRKIIVKGKKTHGK